MSLIEERSSGATQHDRQAVGAEAQDGPLEPNGPIAAALLAAGLACAAFGVLVVLAEVSTAVKELLTVSQGAGPLSGKGLGATALWVVAWGALHLVLRGRELAWRPVARATAALVGVGLVATFPPVFQLFAH